MAAAASFTLALLHFRVWLARRDERAILYFSVSAIATAAVSLMEYRVSHSETTAQYTAYVRWTFIPLWFQLVFLIWFVWVFFGTGRKWLALSSVGLWTLTVIINFWPGQGNLVYKTMTGLRAVEFGGENFVVAEGVENPWNAVNYLGTLLMLVFVLDASIALWRRGGRRRAVVVGGGIVFFFVVAAGHCGLIESGHLEMPYMIGFSYLAIVIAMSSELTRDLLHAAEVSRQLQQSEVKAAQHRAELAHLTRVTTLSELAASLAHELNQPLTAILSNANAAQRFLNADPVDMDEVRDILKDIAEEDERASEIISRMRAMMKKGEAEMKPRDLNAKIREVLVLLHGDLVARNISLSFELSPRLPLVNGDRVQLEQVLLNLILNGCDAMSVNAPGERRLIIQTGREGGLVRVSVVDRGVGLAPELLEQIFEPFYSTKPNGLGLGLPICRSIITAHGGRLWAENNSDCGATFHFTLEVAKGGPA